MSAAAACPLCFTAHPVAPGSLLPTADTETDGCCFTITARHCPEAACQHLACLSCAVQHLRNQCILTGKCASVFENKNSDGDEQHGEGDAALNGEDKRTAVCSFDASCPRCRATATVKCVMAAPHQGELIVTRLADNHKALEHLLRPSTENGSGSGPPSGRSPASEEGHSKGKRAGRRGGKERSEDGAGSEAAPPSPAPNVTPPLTAAVCGICEEADGAAECRECQFALCEGCQRSVHSKGRFKQHTVVPLGTLSASSPVKCSVHPTYAEELFCDQCRVPMCLLCSFQGAHKGHPAKPLQAVVEELKAAVVQDVGLLGAQADLIIALRGELAAQEATLDTQKQMLVEGIKDAFLRLTQALQTREQALIDTVAGIHAVKKSCLARNIAVAAAVAEEVRTVKVRCQTALEGQALAQFIAVAPIIRQRLDDLARQRLFTESQTLAVYSADQQNDQGGGAPREAPSVHDWAKQYMPDLQDTTFRLKPNAETTGRSSTTSDSDARLSGALRDLGDDEFASLILRAGEVLSAVNFGVPGGAEAEMARYDCTARPLPPDEPVQQHPKAAEVEVILAQSPKHVRPQPAGVVHRGSDAAAAAAPTGASTGRPHLSVALTPGGLGAALGPKFLGTSLSNFSALTSLRLGTQLPNANANERSVTETRLRTKSDAGSVATSNNVLPPQGANTDRFAGTLRLPVYGAAGTSKQKGPEDASATTGLQASEPLAAPVAGQAGEKRGRNGKPLGPGDDQQQQQPARGSPGNGNGKGKFMLRI